MALYSNAPSSNPLALDGLVSGVFDTLYVNGQPVLGNSVPYVGAVADVDLGTFGLRATTLRAGPVSQSLRIQAADGLSDYATFNYGGMGSTGQGIYITNGGNQSGTCDLTFTGKFQLKDSFSRQHLLTEWIGAPRNLSRATMGRIRLAQNTSDRALVIDATGEVESSSTSAAQIGYLNTLTGNVQTQIANIITSLGAYLPLAGGTMTSAATINMAATGSITNILNLSTASPASKFSFFQALEFNDNAQAIMQIFGGSNLPNVYTHGLLHPWGNIRTDTGHDTTWTLAGTLYFKDAAGASTAAVSNGAVIMYNSRPITTDGGNLVLQTANPGIITLNPGGGGLIAHKYTSSQYRLTARAVDDCSIAFVDEDVSQFPSWRLSREVNTSRLVFRDSSSVVQLALSSYVAVPVSLRLPYLTSHPSYHKCLIIGGNSQTLHVEATDTPTFTSVVAEEFSTLLGGRVITDRIQSTAGLLQSTLVVDAYDTGAPMSYSTINFRINHVGRFNIGDAAVESFVDFLCPSFKTTYGLFDGLIGVGQQRIVCGNYGVIVRNDGGAFYFLLTSAGGPYGGWNALRPFIIDLASGNLYSSNSQRFCTTHTECATTVMHGTQICHNNPSTWDLYSFFAGATGTLGGPAAFNSQSPGFGIGYDRQYNPGHVRLIALEPAIQWKEMHYGAHIHVFWTFGVNLCGYVNAGGFVSLSDGRAKRDVRPIKTSRSLERILSARPVTYRRIMPDDDKMIPDSERLQNHIGLIAQEVRDFNPHAVDSSASNEKQEYLGIRYNDFVIHLIGAVQEQQKQITALEAKLEAKLEALQPWGSSPRPDADVAPGRRAEPYTGGADGLGTFQSASALEARLAAAEAANTAQQEQIDRLAAALQSLTETLTAQALRVSERALSPNLSRTARK